MIKLIFTLLSIPFTNAMLAQDYVKVPLTKNEQDKKVVMHFIATQDYAGAELYLYHNGNFTFDGSTCLSNSHSEGTWKLEKGLLQFTSHLQKDNLPVKIYYRDRSQSDSLIKRIAIPKDLTGQDIPYSLIAINSDSTTCIYGDWICNPGYTKIDSVKIILETGISSNWLKVTESNKIVQLEIQTSIDLQHYSVYNERYRIRGKKLVYLSD